MRNFFIVLFVSIALTPLYAQNSDTAKVSSENEKYFYKVTQNPFSKLKKNEVAFVYKGVEYRIQGGTLFKKRIDKDKLRKIESGEVMDIMNEVPATARLFGTGAQINMASSTIGGPIAAIVGSSMMKHAMNDFYDDFLSKLPKENAQYAINYKPKPFVKLTDLKATQIGYDSVAFLYDGYRYFTRSKLVCKETQFYSGFFYQKRKIRPLGPYEICDLMGKDYGVRYLKGYRLLMAGAIMSWCPPVMAPLIAGGRRKMKKSIDDFYDAMNNGQVSSIDFKSEIYPDEVVPDASQQSETVVNSTAAPKDEPVVDNSTAQNETAESIVEPAAAPAENVAAVETVAKEEPKAAKEEVEKEEKAKEEKVKEEKVKKERGPKLNERKRNGYGIFVDAGGALFEGPRLGLEMRFNRCIPSVFVGYPNFGYFFKKDHEDISDLQSISAGAGVKGLVPMRIGGFYAGGTLLYERYAGETNPSTVESQKVLYNDGSVLANIGFRFQTKFNLFFNLGFMAGPNFSFGNARFSNPLNYDYTPKYQSEDMKISLKKMGELSIGYEF